MELLAEFLRDVWWPVFAVAALLVLRSRLVQLGERLATPAAAPRDVLRRGLGSEALDAERRAALRSLSTDELDLFLLLSYSDQHQYDTGLPPEQLLPTLRRLAQAGLITIVDETNPRYVTHETTAFGKRLRALLVSGAGELLRDSG